MVLIKYMSMLLMNDIMLGEGHWALQGKNEGES